MRNGRKNCQVEIWRPGSSDATGEPHPAPTLVKSIWGYLFPQRGYEETRYEERRALTFYQIRFDYLDAEGITEFDIVKFEGRTFDILSVMPDLSTRKTIDLQLVEKRRGA